MLYIITKKYILLLFICIAFTTQAQTIKGIVLDAKTKVPIETATIYFDNTTYGAIINVKGEFSIDYNDAIQSPLIISFLGYQKQIITDYRRKTFITIELKESIESLGQVVLNADDGLTRKQKLKFFRKEFLGSSKFGKSCTILNENDVVLRFNRKRKQLTAYAKNPLKIENKGLQYLVSCDLNSFELNFSYISKKGNNFSIKSVGFLGSMFYRDLPVFNKTKAKKHRDKAYKGSIMQFMRALYAETLEKNGFQIFKRSFKVKPETQFLTSFLDSSKIKKVVLKNPVNILFKNKHQSRIEVLKSSFLVDQYGNYDSVIEVRFSGYMGSKRMGDLLPFNYGLKQLLPN